MHILKPSAGFRCMRSMWLASLRSAISKTPIESLQIRPWAPPVARKGGRKNRQFPLSSKVAKRK